jgi:hypothetical protein
MTSQDHFPVSPIGAPIGFYPVAPRTATDRMNAQINIHGRLTSVILPGCNHARSRQLHDIAPGGYKWLGSSPMKEGALESALHPMLLGTLR